MRVSERLGYVTAGKIFTDGWRKGSDHWLWISVRTENRPLLIRCGCEPASDTLAIPHGSLSAGSDRFCRSGSLSTDHFDQEPQS